MVGQLTATTKPSRSDEVPDPDQQVEITNRVRAQFDSLAPKRPAKPNRSEPDPAVSLPLSDHNIDIPELEKLRSLQSQSHGKLLGKADDSVVQDEFVETDYYKELAAIDKQHHTTGSGFIRLVKEGDGDIKGNGCAETTTVAAAIGDGGCYGGDKAVFKTNPATNDWVPAMEDHKVFVSSKPNRSESS